MASDRYYGLMWDQALELCERAERLHRRFLRYLGPRSGDLAWEAPVDIQETRDGCVVLVALPGVAEKDIELHFDRGELTVSAVRPSAPAEPGAMIRRLEIPYGRFFRQVALSTPDLALLSARYDNGCLEVRFGRLTLSK